MRQRAAREDEQRSAAAGAMGEPGPASAQATVDLPAIAGHLERHRRVGPAPQPLPALSQGVEHDTHGKAHPGMPSPEPWKKKDNTRHFRRYGEGPQADERFPSASFEIARTLLGRWPAGLSTKKNFPCGGQLGVVSV